MDGVDMDVAAAPGLGADTDEALREVGALEH